MRKILLILILSIVVFCCSCSMRTITSDSNNEYRLIEYDDDVGDFELVCGRFYSVNADTLQSYSEQNNLEPVSIPANAVEAVQIGSSILDLEYENWTETKSVVVKFNEVANAWIIHGQLTDRNSTEKTGAIAIDAENGDILCIVCE